MLLDLLFSLPPRVARWLSRVLGISAGLHDWFDSVCPCGGEH